MPEKNYSGVSWSRKEQCWKSKVKINGIIVLVGVFADQKQAVIARDTKIIQHGLKLKLQILKPKNPIL